MDEQHRRALDKFQEGKSAMQFALDTSAGGRIVAFPLEITSDTAKRKYRKYCSDNLVCLVDGCHGPLEAHFRTTKASGYVHKNKNSRAHGGPGYWHELAEILIAHWARAQGATAHRQKTMDNSKRRPDVTIITPSGAKIAVEIQYSGMSVSDYRERNLDHGTHFAACVWLLGHTAPNLRMRDERLTLNSLARAIAEDGNTLLWLNPTGEGHLLTAWDGPIDAPRRASRSSAVGWEISSLSECRLDDREGILTPAGERLRDAVVQREKRVKAQRSLARKQQRLRDAAQERARKRWEDSPDRQWLAQEHSSIRVPLTATRPGDRELASSLGVTCEHWKTAVLRQISLAESWVSWGKVRRHLEELGDRSIVLSSLEHRALECYLRDLHKARLIYVKGTDHTPTSRPIDLYTRKGIHPPRRRAAAPALDAPTTNIEQHPAEAAPAETPPAADLAPVAAPAGPAPDPRVDGQQGEPASAPPSTPPAPVSTAARESTAPIQRRRGLRRFWSWLTGE